MHPLTITVTPALALDLGNTNLRNFIDSGYNHIQINPDPNAMRILNRQGFIEWGFPYFGWLVAIQAGVVRMAINLNIHLLFYGGSISNCYNMIYIHTKLNKHQINCVS